MNYNLKLFQINDIDIKEIKIEKNIIKLLKGYMYKLEYNVSYTDKNIEIYIGKREIQKYDSTLDKKSFYIRGFSSYFFINFNEMEKPMNESFLFSDYDYYRHKEFEIAYLNTDNIKDIDLDNIEYNEKIDVNSLKKQCIMFSENIKSNFVLLKITYISSYKSFYFYFHIYENCITEEMIYSKHLLLNNDKETLLIFNYEDESEIIISNNTNIKSLKTFKTNYFNYASKNKINHNLFYVSILPSSTASEINVFQDDFELKAFNKDYSLNNFLHLYYNYNGKYKYFWLFENNNNSIVYFNKYFGDAKIFYSEKIDYDVLHDLVYSKNQLKRLNYMVKVQGPFLLYMEYFDKTFLELLINDENYLKINFNNDDNVLKFLEANKIYKFESIENMIRIEINDTIAKIIEISTQKTKYTLTKDNPFIDINETFNGLGLLSEEDTYIKIYHNIRSLYKENIYTIEFSKDNFEQDMIINITYNNTNELKYFSYYGYKDLIPSNLVKINYKNQFLLINNPYEKFDITNSNKKYYIYIFTENIKYTVKYINKYKLSSTYFAKITPVENHYFLPEKISEDKYSILEILFCNDEKRMELKLTDFNGKETNLSIEKNIIKEFKDTMMVQFDYNYKFILISGEASSNYFKIENKVQFYIPQANETCITILIKNDYSYYNINFTIILLEEKENINLKESLDNPCFLFQFLENDINLDYNYLVVSESSDSNFKYIEINTNNKFTNKKNIYIKIISYSNEFKSAFFSEEKKIYIENIAEENNINETIEEDNSINIEENKEYSINNNEFMFKYNLKKNHLNILPIIFLTYYNTYNINYYVKTEIEIINPLFQTFTYQMDNGNTITLNSTIIKDFGNYFFIFRNCLGVKFYIHNTINTFSLNGEIKNYQAISFNNASEAFISFSLNLDKDRYIYIKNACLFYIYSKRLKKIIDKVDLWVGDYNKYSADDYFIFSIYEQCSFNQHEIAIYSNHFLIDNEIPFSQEIVSYEINRIQDGSIHAVLDLNNSQKNSYMIIGNLYHHFIKCIESKDIDDIIKKESGSSYSHTFDSHFFDPTSYTCPNDKPFISLKFANTVFELISDIRKYNESQNIILQKGNDIIGIELSKTNKDKNYYYLVFSDHENLRYLNQTKIDNSKIIFQRAEDIFEFKINLCENEETKIKIRILENTKNITIINIKNNEACELLDLSNHKDELKYYINLLKKDVIVSYYELKGSIQIYLLKEELNDILIEKILNSDSIDETIFELQNSNTIIIKPYKIMAIKYLTQEISQYFCMNSIIQDFIIYNSVKNIQANKNYILKLGTKVLLEQSIKTNINLYNYNSDEIYNLNQLNNTFENDIDNLRLISDENTVIYLFYKLRNDSKLHQFIFKREYVDKKVLILENNYEKYYYGYGYENYEPVNKYELKFNYFIKIYNPYQNITLPNDFIYAIYSENDEYPLYNLDFNLKSGYNLLESNNYISSLEIKNPYKNKNLFYQYIECEEFTDHKFNLILNGYDNREIQFSFGDFIDDVEYLSLYYNTNKASIFNFYFTQYDEFYYLSLLKNDDKIFNIYFINRTLIQVEILPVYVEYKLDYYFIYKIQNNSSTNNQLNNICYIQRIIEHEINENYNFQKISLNGDKLVNISLNTTFLENNYIIYSNIFVKGNILDGINEIFIYEANIHMIKESDFPVSPDSGPDEEIIPDNKNGDNDDSGKTKILLVILIPCVFVLGIIIFLIVCKIRKSKISIENEIKNENLCELTDK